MEIKTIEARVVKANDLEARRISAAENLQREDLSAIETIEGTVEMVDVDLIEDAELIEDIKYQRSEVGRQRLEVGSKGSEGRKRKLQEGDGEKAGRSCENIIGETSFNHKQQRSRFEGF